MWQDLITYSIVGAVVLIVLYRIGRSLFGKPKHKKDNSCGGCDGGCCH